MSLRPCRGFAAGRVVGTWPGQDTRLKEGTEQAAPLPIGAQFEAELTKTSSEMEIAIFFLFLSRLRCWESLKHICRRVIISDCQAENPVFN